MPYNVYKVAYLGAPRDHHGLFVETEPDGTGILIHVFGNIQSGMMFEEKKAKRPEDSNSFVEKTFLGIVSTRNYYHMVETCGKIPPPKKQFNGGKRLYPKEPLRRCQEWTDEAVQALSSQGILQTTVSASSSSTITDTYWKWSKQYRNWYHDNGDGTFEWSQSNSSSGVTGKGKGKARGMS